MTRLASKVMFLGVLMGFTVSAMPHNCDAPGRYLRGYYQGDCDEDTELPHGRGEARGADKYEGEWVHGKPSGKGIYIWENGARHEGEFKNGKVNGRGVYTTPEGVRYEGGFKDGRLEGLKSPDCPSTPGPLTC